MQKRKLLTLIAGAAMLAALPVQAQGSFPDKLITFVVPFPPGGPTDAMARILATELTKELGQSVVVENRAGAGGNIGAEYLARSNYDPRNMIDVIRVLKLQEACAIEEARAEGRPAQCGAAFWHPYSALTC